MKRKNIIAVTLCAAVVLSLGACQNKGKEAEEKAGFEITVPDQLNGMKRKIFLLWKRMERTSAAITERQIPLIFNLQNEIHIQVISPIPRKMNKN